MKLLRIAGLMISLLSIIYIVYKIILTKVNFSVLFNSSSISFLTIGLLIHLLSLLILAQAYRYTLGFFQKNNRKKIAYISFYAKTNLAKYLPGNIMHLVSRSVSASAVGVAQRPVLLSSVLEIILILFAALILIILIKPDQIMIVVGWLRPLHVILIAALLIILFLILLPRLKSVKEQVRERWRPKLIAKFFGVIGMYMVVLILQALIPILIAFSLTDLPVEVSIARNIANGFLLSWTAGFLAIGAPGGIGVREIVFYSMLPEIASGSLLFISIGQRIVNIAGDITFFLLILLFENPKINF